MFTNEDRVNTVDEHLNGFKERMGMECEDPTTIAGDMICNMLHWVAARTGSTVEALTAVRRLDRF